MTITWILERGIFTDNHDRLISSIRKMGQQYIAWDDDWWDTSKINSFNEECIIFHGSLNNAARIHSETKWVPGAYCNTEAFKCTSWYPKARPWLLNNNWTLTTVTDFVENPQKVLNRVSAKDEFFVRPNSPLKPFSGRRLKTGELSMKTLDYGFYYEDKYLEIIVAPVQAIQDEWRYIVVNGRVVAGSGYAAETRTEISAVSNDDSWLYAQTIASKIEPLDDVYIMDICLVDEKLKLLELNPFSGADLYACNRDSIVESITGMFLRR